MADEVKANVTETKADVLPAAEPVQAPVAEPAKPEPVKQEAVKTEAAIAAPAKPAPAKPAPAAKAPDARQPARRVAKAAKKVKTRKPARKAVVRTAKPVPAKPVVKTASKPARAGLKIVKKETKVMTTQTKKAAETAQFAADQIKTVFGDVNERAKGAMEKTAKVAEELADLTRGNVEAFVASSKLAAKGVEAISQNAAEYSRKSFEDASTALKSFAEVKSATDFFKLQGDFARSAFDAAVAESARVSETVLKLAGDVAEPLTSRYSVAAERVKTLAA
ncbi:MAG TPA: TIGR01841 family phasin [Allosphingosinicella sp.]